MPAYRNPTHNFTYVSSCVKYMIFLLNFIFWLFGGLLIGIGFYAFVDKWQATGLIKLETFYDIVLNISLVMIIAGGIVFVVSFAGCLGALRENTCLLKFYSLCLLMFFLCEMAVAIVGFVFPHKMNIVLEESFTDKIITTYRDDPDLQNLIDFAQQVSLEAVCGYLHHSNSAISEQYGSIWHDIDNAVHDINILPLRSEYNLTLGHVPQKIFSQNDSFPKNVYLLLILRIEFAYFSHVWEL